MQFDNALKLAEQIVFKNTRMGNGDAADGGHIRPAHIQLAGLHGLTGRDNHAGIGIDRRRRAVRDFAGLAKRLKSGR